MAFFLGVDTGGTYTDAVILRDETEVVASAKALTTRHDLSFGISEAIRNVIDKSSIKPMDISLVSQIAVLSESISSPILKTGNLPAGFLLKNSADLSQ